MQQTDLIIQYAPAVQTIKTAVLSPHTHLAGAKELQDRYYYIHRTAEEHLSVEKMKQLIRDKAHEHQGDMHNN